MNRHLFEDRKRRKLFIKSFKNQTLIGTLKGGLDDAYRKSYYDLKTRIDETIEYIENNQLVFEKCSKTQINEWFNEFYRDTLNILNGENNE